MARYFRRRFSSFCRRRRRSYRFVRRKPRTFRRHRRRRRPTICVIKPRTTKLVPIRITSSVTTTTVNSLSDVFRLDYLPDLESYLKVFDEYKLCGISVKLHWDRSGPPVDSTIDHTTIPGSAWPDSVVPTCYIYWDHNDVNPLTVSVATQLEHIIIKHLDRTGYFYSGYSKVYYQAPSYNYDGSWLTHQTRGWLPCSMTAGVGGATVPHYAFKLVVSTNDYYSLAWESSVIGTIAVEYRYYIKFRNTK